MKKISSYLAAVFLVIAIGLLIWIGRNTSDQQSKLTLHKDKVTLVQTLKEPDGTVLGDINVLNLRPLSNGSSLEQNINNVFDALYLTKRVEGKDIILYKINNEGFFNTFGKDLEIPNEGFYGYQFVKLYDDHFVLHLLRDGGKIISDNATIVWNPTKNVFETYKPIADLPPEPLGNLIANNGSQLGKIEGFYLDPSKKIFNLVLVYKYEEDKQIMLYQVKPDGFFNTDGKEAVLGSPDDTRGFKVSLVKDDYFVINFVSKDGKHISNDVVVKWNPDKKVFEVQKTP